MINLIAEVNADLDYSTLCTYGKDLVGSNTEGSRLVMDMLEKWISSYSKETLAEDFMRDAGSSRNHEQAQET